MNLEDFDTLGEAQAYTEERQKMVSADMMTVQLLKNNVYSYLLDHTDDICRAISDSIKKPSQFNFMNGDPIGEANKNMMDYLIFTHLEKQSELTALKADLLAYSNEVFYPFGASTDVQFDLAKNPPIEKQVTYSSDSYLTVSTRQGADIKINQSPVDHDVFYKVFLYTCATDPANLENFTTDKIMAGSTTVHAGSTLGLVSLTNNRLRMYNNFYVLSSTNDPFTAAVEANKG